MKVVIFHRPIDLFYYLLYSPLLLIFNPKGISLGSPSPINPTGLLESLPTPGIDLIYFGDLVTHCIASS